MLENYVLDYLKVCIIRAIVLSFYGGLVSVAMFYPSPRVRGQDWYLASVSRLLEDPKALGKVEDMTSMGLSGHNIRLKHRGHVVLVPEGSKAVRSWVISLHICILKT